MWKSCCVPVLTIAFLATWISICNVNCDLRSNQGEDFTQCLSSTTDCTNTECVNTRFAGIFLINRKCLSRLQNASYSGKTCLSYLCLLLIINSSDCHPNPGPRAPKYPGLKCNKAVKNNDPSICCAISGAIPGA